MMTQGAALMEQMDPPRPGRMVSTGIGALDTRLGTLVPGRHYAVTGEPGSGKTTVALHFIAAGLEAGEQCAIVTQESAGDLLAHADHIGCELRSALRDGRLVLVRIRPDFPRRYGRLRKPAAVREELGELLAERGMLPDRLVIDSAAPFLDGSRGSGELVDVLGDFLDDARGTTYLTVPGEPGGGRGRFHDRVITSAAGVFHVSRSGGERRELSIRKLRQKAHRADPFLFDIRPGVGIVDGIRSWEPEAQPDEARQRVLVLDEHGVIPGHFLAALGESFTLDRFGSLETGFSDIVGGGYGALVLGLDPYHPNLTLDLAYSLRNSGNGAPILFIAPREGLRDSTRVRALRAGADDFLTDEASPVEVLERVDAATGRGPRRGSPAISQSPVQPVDARGRPRLMTPGELSNAIERVTSDPSPPMFALLAIRPRGGPGQAWTILQDRVRLKDGDLVALLDDRSIAVVLAHVDADTALDLAVRLRAGNPGEYELLTFPADRDAIHHRFGGEPSPRPLAIHGSH